MRAECSFFLSCALPSFICGNRPQGLDFQQGIYSFCGICVGKHLEVLHKPFTQISHVGWFSPASQGDGQFWLEYCSQWGFCPRCVFEFPAQF